MTRPQDLRDLAGVTEASYRKERAAVDRILSQEARLRTELARLDAQENAARDTPASLDLMRPFGADIAWRAWLGTTRAHLNQKLAVVLAQKEQVMGRVRWAYGRHLVAQSLCRTARQDHAVARRRDAEREAVEIWNATAAQRLGDQDAS